MKLENLLNKQVANLSLFYVKLHNYHWYVAGKKFFTLHEKFEAMYDEITEIYDEVAERMLMLELRPIGTLKEALEFASLKEASGNESAKEMVSTLINDFTQLNNEFKEVIDLAEDLEDDVTVDLMTSTRAKFQKHIWMLKEFNK